MSRQCEPIHLRHKNICDDQVGKLFAGQFQRLDAIICLQQPMAEIAEQGDVGVAVGRICVNNKNGSHYPENENWSSSSQRSIDFCTVHSNRRTVKLIPLMAPNVGSLIWVDLFSGKIDQFHVRQPVLGLVRITLIPHFAGNIAEIVIHLFQFRISFCQQPQPAGLVVHVHPDDILELDGEWT